MKEHKDPYLATLESKCDSARHRHRGCFVAVTLINQKMTEFKFFGKTKTEVYIDPALLLKEKLMSSKTQ
jgi:hypothetical protein